MFKAALFTLGKLWKQAKCLSADARIKTVVCVSIQQGIIGLLKRSAVMTHDTPQRNSENITRNERCRHKKPHKISFLSCELCGIGKTTGKERVAVA